MHRMRLKAVCAPLSLIILFCLALIFAACQTDRVTKANYDKLSIGMSESEVTGILGEPSESSSVNLGPFSGTASKWVGKGGTISIQFLNGEAKAMNYFK